jgi:hypothetical protein
MNKRLMNQREAKSKTLSQKSGFDVWTSGRLVNIWDVKDVHVRVHIRNILWIRGYFQDVKVSSSPYKRGREGTCKGIHNFWGLSILYEILCLLLRHLRFWLERLHIFFSCVRGSYSDSRILPNKGAANMAYQSGFLHNVPPEQFQGGHAQPYYEQG